jgi:hypothetical protein
MIGKLREKSEKSQLQTGRLTAYEKKNKLKRVKSENTDATRKDTAQTRKEEEQCMEDSSKETTKTYTRNYPRHRYRDSSASPV